MIVQETVIQQFVNGYSIEVTPRGLAKKLSLNRVLPKGTQVYVTFLPTAPFSESIEAAISLLSQGFKPVVHVAVRNVRSQKELENGLHSLNKNGIRDILLLAGGASGKPFFKDSLAILESKLLENFEWDSIGFAGHPEGHPTVSDDELWRALEIKRTYAEQHPRNYYLMTQFCFTASPIIAWCEALQKHNNVFPLKIGIPGIASTASLIKHARNCGVGASIAFLLNSGSKWRNLLTGMSEPSQLVHDLAMAYADGKLASNTTLHAFPLGGFDSTVSWLNAIVDGKFTINKKQGIKVNE